MSSIATNALASQTPTITAPSSTAASSTGSLPNSLSTKTLSADFLQLLIAQLKNQDPTNPTDGTAFVTQLATFTNVQQQTQATSDLNSMLSLMQAAAAPVSTTPPTSGTTATTGTTPNTGTTGA